MPANIWNIDDAPVDVGGGKIHQGQTAQEDQGWSWRQLLGCHQGEEVGEVAETIPVKVVSNSLQPLVN